MEANRTSNVRRLSAAVTRLVADANRGMRRAFDVDRVALLGLVAADGPITPGVVAARLGLPASSVTRRAQALADAGHLVMDANPSDARSCLLRITDAGETELDSIADVGAEVFGNVIADWSDADVVALTALVERLVAAWEQRGSQQQARARTAGRRARWQLAHLADDSGEGERE
jgi:DNA-binding MarR family transcriptional regulator